MTESRKRSPADVWRALEKAGADAELERVGAMSGDEVDAELRAAGVDPAEAAKIGEDIVAAAPASTAPRDRRRILWVAALGMAAVIVAVFLAWPRPAPEIASPPTPEQQQAAKMRDDAIDACKELRWDACEEGLNAATALDPEGETDPRVIAARRFIAAWHADAGRKLDSPPKP